MTTLKLLGSCNQCGACCQATYGNAIVTCEHLEVTGEIGEPEATRCLVYDRRYDGMPIRMRGPDGLMVPTRCSKGSVNEIVQVIQRIGRGCSYTVEVS